MPFEQIAPYLANPIILIGFALFLIFGLHRALIRSGVIPTLRKQDAPKVIVLLLRYGFIVALVVIALGFAYAAWKVRAASRVRKPFGRVNAEAFLQRNRASIEACLGKNENLLFLDFLFTARSDGGIGTDIFEGNNVEMSSTILTLLLACTIGGHSPRLYEKTSSRRFINW